MNEGSIVSNEVLAKLQNENWNKYLLENAELLETVSHLLKGEIKEPIKMKDEVGDEYTEMAWMKKPDGRAPINNLGYHFTMLHITQALDKSQASGNLSEEQAMNSINQLMKSLTNVYITKYDEFELQTEAETRTLIISIMNLLKTHITKSIEMALIKQLASSYSITEQRFSPLPKEQSNMTM